MNTCRPDDVPRMISIDKCLLFVLYTICMQRMQILLPSELRQKIRLRAEQDNKPQNQVVRELLEKALTAERPRSTGDALLRLVDLGKRLGVAGPKDWATRHDAYFAKEV